MATQLLIRLDNELKDRLNFLARKEVKTSSDVVREMLRKYIRENDMSFYIDELWANISAHFAKRGIIK